MINPLAWVIDRLLEPVSDYPRVIATHDCGECGTSAGNKHRISTCEGNSRDIRRRLFYVDGAAVSDEQVDRDTEAALEQHRRNQEER